MRRRRERGRRRRISDLHHAKVPSFSPLDRERTATERPLLRCSAIRSQLGDAAKELADRYFLETLVRIHDELAKRIAMRVEVEIRDKFGKAREAGRGAENTVEAGRAHVAAYVEYVHLVEALHSVLAGHEHGD